jgi:hypothetical protein
VQDRCEVIARTDSRSTIPDGQYEIDEAFDLLKRAVNK